MAMNVLQSPSRPGLGKVPGFFWQLVGPPGYFIGNMVYSQQGAIGNMPMAAAFTLVPIVLIALYLAFVKRLGAFDAL